jgi:hypothetical protein
MACLFQKSIRGQERSVWPGKGFLYIGITVIMRSAV